MWLSHSEHQVKIMRLLLKYFNDSYFIAKENNDNNVDLLLITHDLLNYFNIPISDELDHKLLNGMYSAIGVYKTV